MQRAFLGPIGMFVGTTQMRFDVTFSEASGKIDASEPISATIRGNRRVRVWRTSLPKGLPNITLRCGRVPTRPNQRRSGGPNNHRPPKYPLGLWQLKSNEPEGYAVLATLRVHSNETEMIIKTANKHELKTKETRALLLKAAETIFARDGYEGGRRKGLRPLPVAQREQSMRNSRVRRTFSSL